MKSKLQTPAAIFLLLISLGATLAQERPAPPRPAAPVSSGMAPLPPAYRHTPGAGSPVIVDPATGLPIVQPAPEWKDPNWKDPDKTLPEVSYDGLLVSEVARNLSEQFKSEFDILLPHDWEGGTGSENHDWLGTLVHLRLKNVTASEVFNAMNLLFENNQTPLRWELKLNGRRQVALLRVLEEPVPRNDPGSPQRPWRKVFFVGGLIGDEKSGGMTMQQINETLQQVYQISYRRHLGGIQWHTDAQLLIVTATADQMNLIEQTLAALEQKVEMGRARQSKSTGESKPKIEESKSNGASK